MNGFSRKALATLLVPVCLMCAGCDESVAEDTGTQSEAGTEKSVTNCASYDDGRTGEGYSVRECEMKLRDGRRVTCAVLIGYRKGGLSCDWANATKATEKTE